MDRKEIENSFAKYINDGTSEASFLAAIALAVMAVADALNRTADSSKEMAEKMQETQKTMLDLIKKQAGN